MMLRPGSVGWLLRHELRLTWRRSRLAARWKSAGLLALLLATIAHLIGLGAAVWLLDHAPRLADRLAYANVALLVLGGLILSQALDVAVSALFERRDLDWLLASPVPLRRVLGTRMLGIAAGVAVPWLLMLGPVANVLAVMDGPGWLAAYPALCALSLLAAGAGAGVAVGLVSALGLRRARRTVNVMSLVFGALMFLVSQSGTMLTPALRLAVWDALTPPCCGVPGGAGWWPSRAVLGAPVPLAALVLLGISAAVFAAVALDRRFATGAALDPPSRRPGALRGAGQVVRPGRFHASPFRALLRKEMRLLRRTPTLLSRAAFQLVYAVPVALTLLRDGQPAAALGLGSISVFLAGESARLLGSAAVHGDEAAELAGTAPIPPKAAQHAKMTAAALGTAVIALLPVLGVAFVQPGLLPVLLGGIAGVTGSGLLMGLWRSAPARRRDLGGAGPSLGATDWLGLVVSSCWSGATGLAMVDNYWAAAPGGAALVLLACLRPRGKR